MRGCLHAATWLLARMHFQPAQRSAEELAIEVASAAQRIGDYLDRRRHATPDRASAGG